MRSIFSSVSREVSNAIAASRSAFSADTWGRLGGHLCLLRQHPDFLELLGGLLAGAAGKQAAGDDHTCQLGNSGAFHGKSPRFVFCRAVNGPSLG